MTPQKVTVEISVGGIETVDLIQDLDMIGTEEKLPIATEVSQEVEDEDHSQKSVHPTGFVNSGCC